MAAPQLRLEVSLNLAGFRNEIQKLTNIAQSEFAPKINVKFNRQTLDAELNNLQRAIKRRVYRVEIGGNIDALPGKIKNLKEQLASIESLKIDLGIGAVKSLSKRDASKIKSDLRAEILGEQKKIYAPVSIKPSIVKKDVLDFKNAVQSKLSGITVKVKADLEAASISGGAKSRADINADVRRKLQEISEIGAQRMAGGGGGVTEAARRAQLKRSLETGGFDIGGLKDIGKQLGVAGVGRFRNVNNLIEKIVTESSIEMVKKYLDPQAVMGNPDRSGLGKVLDTFARGIFNMLGMDPASIRAQQQSSKPKPFTPAGLLPAAYRGIGPSAEPAGLLPPAYRGIGPSRNAGALPGTAFGGQKYLPTALGEELKEVLRGAANAFLDSIRQNIRTVAITDMGAPPSRQGLLKGGSVAGFLPGRASAASVLELNNILAGAIREYFKAVARDVAEAGRAPISTTPLLSSASPRNQLMLPPAGGTTANLNRPRTTTGSFTGRGYEPPGGFASDGMLGGRQGPATFIGAGSQMQKFKTALDVAVASTQNFRASQIPLIGGIKSLAGEFGEVTKQVLLYGTAYKGLAFLTSLPGQVLNAAKSQQQFNNGLKVATQETGTFAKELLYVDNVQRAFGLNLETTRTGFTRLYASMSPTGFDSGSIEKLFTGISAATASLQLTPDKAERVIYAFGQMASKGQIMAEELKGQLGDVLPGALAIFSKAAGMSVKEFSKAMEDGEFVGNRFREVFAKVSDELINRFGTGAQAAGRSLQGLINTVGGDFQRTLESFSPLANSAAQAILGPLGGSLKQLALSAQIATGEIERVFTQLKESQQNLRDLRTSAGTDGIITADEAKQIKAAEQNVAALTAKYKSLQQAARDPAIAKQVQDITKFTEELSKAGTFVMNVAKTIGGLLSPALNFLGTNLTTVISLITSFYIGFQTARLAAMALMGVLLLFRTLSAILGFGPAALSANTLAAAFNGLGVAATGAQVKVIGLRFALAALVSATVIGAVVGGIMLIAGAFASMRDRAKEAGQSSRDAAKAAVDAAQTGGVAQAAMSVQTILGESRKGTAARKALEGIMARSTKAQRDGLAAMFLTMEESVALKGSSLTEGMVKPAIDGKPQMHVPSKGDAAAIIRQFGSFAGQQDLNLKEAKSALATAQRVAKDIGLDKPAPSAFPPEVPGTGKPPKEQSLESYDSLRDRLAKAQTQADIERMEAEFEHLRALVNVEYDLKEAKANSFQKKAIAFQREIFAITSEQDAALFKNRAKVLAAAGSVAGGVMGAGSIGSGAARLPGSNSGRLDASGQNGADMPVGSNNAIQSYHNGLVKAIGTAGKNGNYIVIDFIDDLGNRLEATYSHVAAAVKVGQSVVGGQVIGRFDASGNTRGAHNSVDINSLGNRGSFQRNQETSAARRSADILVTGRVQGRGAGSAGAAVAPGKVTGDVKRDKLAEQQVALTARETNAANIEKEAEAVAELKIATANYVQSLLPTSEQALQNQLLQQRITLTQNSFSPEILEAQLAFAEQELRVAESMKIHTEEINRLTAAGGKDVKRINALTDANNQLKANLPVSAIQLYTKVINEQVDSLVRRNKTAMQDAADQERVNGLIIGGMTRQAAEAKVAAENLRGNYKKALEEATRQVEIAAAAEEVLAAARRLGKKETAEQTAEYNRLAQALRDAKKAKEDLKGKAPEVEGAATGVEGSAVPKTTSSYIADGLSAAQERLAELTNTGYQVVQAANAIGDAFGTAFKGLVSGSMTAQEALAGMFQSIADHFADMVAQMIAEYLKMALIKGIMSIIGMVAGAAAPGLSSAFGASGPSFNAGAFSGPALSPGAAFGGGGAPDFSGAFGGGGAAFNPSAFSIPAFANGGMVTGPTMGLVGEGRYNEAIVPLPDGKSIPVQLAGGGSSSPTVIVNVDAKGSQVEGNEQNANQLGRVISAAVQTELIKQQRPGGLLAR